MNSFLCCNNIDSFVLNFMLGVFFITINSEYYRDSSLVESLKDKHDTWFDKQLELAATAKHTVVFVHIPLFLENADEDDQYFNFPMKARRELLDKLHNAGVKYVFAGHYHRNAGGFHGDLEMIVTSAIGYPLGNDSNGVRIVTVQEDKITHSFLKLEDASKNVYV